MHVLELFAVLKASVSPEGLYCRRPQREISRYQACSGERVVSYYIESIRAAASVPDVVAVQTAYRRQAVIAAERRRADDLQVTAHRHSGKRRAVLACAVVNRQHRKRNRQVLQRPTALKSVSVYLLLHLKISASVHRESKRRKLAASFAASLRNLYLHRATAQVYLYKFSEISEHTVLYFDDVVSDYDFFYHRVCFGCNAYRPARQPCYVFVVCRISVYVRHLHSVRYRKRRISDIILAYVYLHRHNIMFRIRFICRIRIISKFLVVA